MGQPHPSRLLTQLPHLDMKHHHDHLFPAAASPHARWRSRPHGPPCLPLHVPAAGRRLPYISTHLPACFCASYGVPPSLHQPVERVLHYL